MPSLRELSLLLVLSFVPLACGSAEVGDECDDVGDTDECEDDAICTNEGDSSEGTCRWLCENDEDCPADHECNGVSGTNVKSCQPK
jgi:hypothetical protein